MRVVEVFTPYTTDRDHYDHGRYEHHHGHRRGYWKWDWRHRRRYWCWDD